MKVFSFLLATGLKLDVCIYASMIKGLCKGEQQADAIELFNKMDENGCPPDSITYNTVIKGFLLKNEVSKALEFLHLMTGKGFAADDYTRSLFMDSLRSTNVSGTMKAQLREFFGIQS